MRILLVEFTSAVSGGERSLLELVQGLRGDHELTLACPSGPLAGHGAALGVRVSIIPPSQLTFRLHPRHTLRGITDMVRAARRLRRIATALRPDVIHANSIRAGLLAIPAARGVGPLVVHCRDTLPPGLAGTVVRCAVRIGADHVVAISRHVATSLAGAGWVGRGVTVVDNAVDLARFDPATLPTASACRSELGLGAGLVLSVIAQITPWKGQDLAIRALAELRRRGTEAVLLVVGEAKFVGAATRHDNRAFEDGLRLLVEEGKLDECVRFLGERSDPERILTATDVLLVPSTEEPFGRTIIEAMAIGVPVAATNVGGPPEILREGIGGRLVPGRDATTWADAVEELATWGPDRRAAARAAAEARFSRERHTEAMLAVYATARATRRQGRGSRA
jgi:glycosyltransferase involved in cell wall biosynthesis